MTSRPTAGPHTNDPALRIVGVAASTPAGLHRFGSRTSRRRKLQLAGVALAAALLLGA